MQDVMTPIMKDYLKRMALVSVACSLALVLIVLAGRFLSPLLGVGVVTMLGILALDVAVLVCGDRAGLFRFKMDEFMTYMTTPMRDDGKIDKRSAATATAALGSLISALLLTFMIETQTGLPLLLVPPLYISIALVLITISSNTGRIAASAKESILTLLMIVALFGYAYGSDPVEGCGDADATGLSIECEAYNSEKG